MAMHHICLVALLLLGVGADVSVKAPETAAQVGDASALLQNEDAGEEAETLSAEESSQEEEDDEDDDDDDEEGEEGEGASLLQGATDAAGEDAEEEVAAQEGDAEVADDKDDEDDGDEDDDDDVEPTSEALLAQLDENKDGKLSLEELTKGQSDEAEITHMKEAIKKVDLDADALVNIEELPKLTALAEADDNEEGDDDDDDDEGGEEGEDASLLQGASDAGGEDAEEVAAAADAKVDNKVDAKVDANGDAKVEDDEEDEDDEEEDDEDAEAEDDVEDEHDKTPEALMTQYDTSKDGKLSLEELTLGESDEAEVKNIKDALKKVDADADGFVNMEELPKFVSQMKPLDDM